ncbi:hypothetical protein DL771_010181 [Monosporascus sp. 5C6A]|nr:hypothetical protein DL771_010181 [Monosporascus sp. 5C6A]
MVAADPRGLGEPLFYPPDAKVEYAIESTFTCEIARVFRFGYNSNLDDFYPDPKQGKGTIDVHSTVLLQGLTDRRDTESVELSRRNHPIIFVACDLGGLVCANVLSLPNANKRIIDSIRGFVFLGTPFEGKSRAKWAEVADRLPALRGSRKPDNLQERSQALVSINENFLKFLNTRRPLIKVECFYDEYIATAPWPDLDPQRVSDKEFGNIANLLIQWIKKLSSPPAEDEKPTHYYGDGWKPAAPEGKGKGRDDDGDDDNYPVQRNV